MNSSTGSVGAPETPLKWSASTLAGRMQAGVALNLLGTAFTQGSTFAVNLVVANLLGRESFGHYTMVLATVATVATIGQLSMGYTATKHVAEFRSIERARTSRILALCGSISGAAALLGALALVVAADWLAQSVLGAPGLAPQLRIAGGAVFFTILNGFFIGALAGLESYPAIAVSGVLSGTVYVVLCSILAWTHGLSGAVAGVAMSACVQAAILFAMLRREAHRCGIAITYRGSWQERGILTSFAMPASLTGLITLPAVWIASALLARQPGGFQQLALFGAANSFRVMVLFVPQAFNNVSMSLLNNQRRSSAGGYRRVFWMNAAWTAVSASAAAGVFLLAGSSLLRLFGPGFEEGRMVLAILLGAAVIEAITLAVYQIVVSHGKMWASLFSVSLPRDLTIVLLAAALTPAFGASGLGAAHAAGWMVGLLGTLALAWRLVRRDRPQQESAITISPRS